MKIDELDDEINQLLEEYDDLEFSDDETGSQDQTKLYLQKFQNKVDFAMKSGWQTKDKSDRATTDHALDRRSRAILFKMMNQEVFSEINGCISTGEYVMVAKLCCRKGG